ncbi:MAG TPA: hypothetical protein VF893_00725 [Candidatus Bathyarchaeia archaeon]
MSVELKLLISLLKLTSNGSVIIENIKREARIPTSVTENLLQTLQNQHLVHIKDNIAEVSTYNRLKLAVKAWSLGGDIEQVCELLCWREFEEIAALALRNNGYTVAKNIHFKHGGRKWEMDVVGCKKPLIVCFDCKHYHQGMSPSATLKIAEAQRQRTEALAAMLPSTKMTLDCTKWVRSQFVPAILSLLPARVKFCEGIPIVPVLQLQDFLSQLPMLVASLIYVQREFSHLS